MQKELLIKLLAKHLNVPALMSDVIDEVLEPALDKFINDTSNPYDNMLKIAIYPVIEAELKRVLVEKWAELQA